MDDEPVHRASIDTDEQSLKKIIAWALRNRSAATPWIMPLPFASASIRVK
jgi:hypothetical protein